MTPRTHNRSRERRNWQVKNEFYLATNLLPDGKNGFKQANGEGVRRDERARLR